MDGLLVMHLVAGLGCETKTALLPAATGLLNC